MGRCPNCARETLRTKDWVCQWCGYPLLSGFYRKIDKTFNEIQQERGLSAPPPEDDFKEIHIPETPVAPAKMVPTAKETPVPEIKPEVPAAERKDVQPPPTVTTEKAPVIVVPPRVTEPVRPAAPPPEPRPSPVRSEREDTAPPLSAQTTLPPFTPLRLDEIVEGAEISVDQLDALFRADRAAVHARLKDKTINIRGVVGKVFIRDHIDVRYIILNGQRGGTLSARCSFDRANSAAFGRLNEGEAVLVRGKYDGYSKNILFRECTLNG